MIIKLRDFTPSTLTYVANWENLDDGKSGQYGAFTVNNAQAVAIFPHYDYDYNEKKYVRRGSLDLIVYARIEDYPGAGAYRVKYDGNYKNGNIPTLESFKEFYGYDTAYKTTVPKTANGIDVPGTGNMRITFSISGVPVFCANSVDLNYTFGNKEYVISNADYFFDDYEFRLGYYPNCPREMMLVNSGKKHFFKHLLYVNGGKLGKGDNYTITEVIKSSEDNPIKWVSNEESKLKCYKYDLAQSQNDYWETKLDSKKLDTNRDSSFQKVMSTNSVSTIQQQVAFNTNTIVPYPFFTYELIPRFLLNGSQFTGNRYNITFPKNLPSSSEGVNNAWANVVQIGSDTDANNEVIVLYGEPPTAETPDEQTKEDLDDTSQNNGDDNSDSESKKPSSTDIHYGSESGSANELTKLYVVSSAQLDLLGQSLWSESYLNVLKIQDNPIENIISIKKFPFSISGTSENITIGNVELNVTGDRITKGVHTIDFPQVKVGGKYGNFLDYEPFTSLKISLCYCGIYDLPISECMNKNLSVKYIIDLIHGDCIALVLIDGYPLYEFNGNMGVNVPITQTDRTSAEAKHIQNVSSSIMQGASGGVGGALVGAGYSMIESGLSSYNVSHTASGSGAINLASVQDVRLIYSRPLTTTKDANGTYYPYPKNYGHTHGYPCNKYMQIDTLNGFFKCGDNIDLSNIKASKDIKDKIIDMLKGGVYK